MSLPREYLEQKVGKYWKLREVMCPCCGLIVIVPVLVEWMDWLRESYGEPILAGSWTRCVRHNSAVGGKMWSRHKKGLAVDPRPLRYKMDDRFVELAKKFPFCKVYATFCHVDVRGLA